MNIENIMGILQPYEDYMCLNDYFHFMDHHAPYFKQRQEANEERKVKEKSNATLIREYFVRECGETQEYECVSFRRLHRDRYKPLPERYYNCAEDNYQLIAFQQIFDSIYCSIFHPIMYENDQVSVEENRKRKINIMRQRHTNMYTIDTGIDIKTDAEIQAENEFKMMQYELEAKQEVHNEKPLLHESTPSMSLLSGQLTKQLQKETASLTGASKSVSLHLHRSYSASAASPKSPKSRNYHQNL